MLVMTINTPLTPQEVAEMLKISKSTVYDLIKKNLINSYKVGKKLRIDLNDVEEYINRDKKIADAISIKTEPVPIVNFQQIEGSLNKHQSDNATSSSTQFILCGQDIMLDIISRHFGKRKSGISNLRSYQGSYDSLYSLYKGDTTVATAHLWDYKSGLYNIPFVENMLPGTPCLLINLAYINVGFYVKKGNPKKITSWNDLSRNDIVMINREAGSGTRVLLDGHIQKLGLKGKDILGYQKEALAHIGVASSVARDKADFGVGSEKSSYQVKDIDFIPLQKERYDLIIKKEDLSLSDIQLLLEVLSSEELRLELESLGGYDISHIGEVVGET